MGDGVLGFPAEGPLRSSQTTTAATATAATAATAAATTTSAGHHHCHHRHDRGACDAHKVVRAVRVRAPCAACV